MKEDRWLRRNVGSLEGKYVAVTGATGGIGREICRAILQLGGKLLMLNRDHEKTEKLQEALLREFPEAEISFYQVDLSDMDSVRKLCRRLQQVPLDVLIHNAGIYSVPRKICATGLENIFQVNFVSPYYMTRQLLDHLASRQGVVVAVGSIAHNYAHTDPEDVDFSKRKAVHLAYGNSKRYLMFALWELMEQQTGVRLTIAHPGLTVTNMTAHFPKALYAVMKGPMTVLFMKPQKACRGIIRGIFEDVPYLSWIGPGIFHVWGNPVIRKVTTCRESERKQIAAAAEKIYDRLLSQSGSVDVLDNSKNMEYK